MRFSKKIFIAVFIATFALGTFVIQASYRHTSRQAKEEYISRYSTLSKVMGNTLTRLDLNTELLMFNAAKVIAARDAEKGLLSTTQLKNMRDELSVTHIFVIDKNGNFVRSTNEDPKLIPNAFSFCEDYRNLYSKPADFAATPIISPQPEPKPYKFLFVPSRDQKRLLEVGVRVDFVAKTLSDTLGSDSNIRSLSLFAPDGTPFGKFDSKNVSFLQEKIVLPQTLPSMVETDDSYRFFTKVTSSHPQCCQCEVTHSSRNGEYYYVLASDVSKKELKALQAKSENMFIVLIIVNALFSLILSRFISRSLVRNIETAVARVRKIKEEGDFKGRIGLEGKDEVSFLTKEFDRMLDSLEESQQKIVETARVQAKIQAAKEVAHNIKSPAIAIEMMIPALAGIPERFKKVLRDSVKDIKTLSARLSKQADALDSPSDAASRHLRPVIFSKAIRDLIQEKRFEHPGTTPQIELKTARNFDNPAILVDPVEFRAVVSNVINNAIQACEDGIGTVKITLRSTESECVAEITDDGVGIPKDVLPQLGLKCVTLKKNGKGIGLIHARRCVSAWGGHLSVDSEVGLGTSVTISLPKVSAPGPIAI